MHSCSDTFPRITASFLFRQRKPTVKFITSELDRIRRLEKYSSGLMGLIQNVIVKDLC